LHKIQYNSALRVNALPKDSIMQAITYSEARNNLAHHLDRVVDDCDFTVITRRSGEAAVLMSLREFESWQETMFLLRGKNGPRLLKAVEDIRNRRNLVKHELIDE
jgi:antitoxin YefM